jgi:hypothetical protein
VSDALQLNEEVCLYRFLGLGDFIFDEADSIDHHDQVIVGIERSSPLAEA